MKIRTQLIIAFLLLAVVPLTSIVLYSYFTSIKAVQRAVEEEANERTQEMEKRLEVIKAKLQRGFEGLRRFPFRALLRRPGAPPMGEAFLGRLVSDMGDAAPFVESLTLVPTTPVPDVPEDGQPLDITIVQAPQAPTSPEPSIAPEPQALKIDIVRLMKDLTEAALVNQDSTENPEGTSTRVDAEVVAQSVQQAMETARHLMRELAEQHRAEFEKEEKLRSIAAIQYEESRRMEQGRRRAERLLGQNMGVTIRDKDGVLGEVHAEVRPESVLRQVMAGTPRDQGEIPFALDAEGKIYSTDEADRTLLEGLDIHRDPETKEVSAHAASQEWKIVSTDYSGLTFGVAHPIGDSLTQIRDTSVRNLFFGLGLIGLSLLGILPLAKRITHGLESVTYGAERIAQGDLTTRVPVSSKSEIGQLASAFNHMAEDLSKQQERLIQEEGRRKEQELEKKFLEAEFERKSIELEDAREFQLSLLPKALPRHPLLEVAVDMQTATEVGGDYYDFILSEEGVMTLAIGDATGHGARAGTMVTVIKSLFTSSAAELPPREFLGQAAKAIKRMELGRMAMALTVARFDDRGLVLSAAGMPPVLCYRAASGETEEIALPGMPLGGLATDYEERRLELAAGDTLLFLSDGLPELPNAQGEPLGYTEVRDLFAKAALAASDGRSPQAVIDAMNAAAAHWAGGKPPSDDMTFVVVQKKGI